MQAVLSLQKIIKLFFNKYNCYAIIEAEKEGSENGYTKEKEYH